MDGIKLVAVMPVLNAVEMTKESLQSLVDNTKHLDSVVVIDDCSVENYGKMFPYSVNKWAKTRAINLEINDRVYEEEIKDMSVDILYKKLDKPSGVTKAWNVGVEIAVKEVGATHIAVVNNDVLYSEDWDVPLIEDLKENMVASPYHTQKELPRDWPMGSERHDNGGFPLLGCAYMFKAEDAPKIFPIDERIKIWYNDTYIVNRVSKGLEGTLSMNKESYVHHYYSKTCNERALPGFVSTVYEDEKQFKIISKEHNWN